MKFRPLGDKILVKRDEAATKTESGIFLPESSKEKPSPSAMVTSARTTESSRRSPSRRATA